MRVISESVLRAHVPLDKAVSNQREAFRVFEASKKTNEVRIPERLIGSTAAGPVLFKPFLSDTDFGLKVVSVRSTGTPGTIVLFDTATAEPTALMNATYLTALRTAAGSAVACELATDANASHTLTVFGAGLQAELHIRCFAAVRRITQVHIVNRTAEKAEQLAQLLQADSSLHQIQFKAVSAGDLPAALSASSMVVTATGASEALFDGRLLRRGTFVAAVGSFQPQMKELDNGVLQRSWNVADNPLAVRKTTGEFADESIPIFASLGELVSGVRTLPAVDEAHELVVFKSIGCAVQDMFIARLALQHCAPAAQEVNL